MTGTLNFPRALLYAMYETQYETLSEVKADTKPGSEQI